MRHQFNAILTWCQTPETAIYRQVLWKRLKESLGGSSKKVTNDQGTGGAVELAETLKEAIAVA